MLVHLHIINFAIIQEVELALIPGLNILTGETGAGKSIIVGAASLLRGGRGSTELIRSGSKEAVVEAVFDLSDSPRALKQVQKVGLPLDGNSLLIRRIIPQSGRNRIYVNGSLCTASVLASITGLLLDISGQHEHQLLSDRSTHRRILDAVGVPTELLATIEKAYLRLRDIAEALKHSRMDEQQRFTRLDFLRYQLEELDRAQLVINEDVDLESERIRLQRASELLEASRSGEEVLYSGDNSITDILAQQKRTLEALSSVDNRLEFFATQLEESRIIIEEVAHHLRRYGAEIEMDPARLQEVEERLDLILRLKRKYGTSISEILSRMEGMRQEYAELNSFELRLEELEKEIKVARHDAEQIAEQLTSVRQQIAQALAIKVNHHLAHLRMEGAHVEVAITPREKHEGDEPALCLKGGKLNATGWDRVEFLISTNPGEPPRSLSRIASGGELARIMLALRQVLGQHDPVSTSIYDEVDAGIGGAVADSVGRALNQVARHRQVLCVTHLPQVAAYADAHFHVGKKTGRERTQTLVKPLSSTERIEELARMLGGEKVSTQARANAKHLLEAAALT